MAQHWRIVLSMACLVPALSFGAHKGHQLSADEERFAMMMEKKHHLPAAEVRIWMSGANIKTRVIKTIKHPAEKKSWAFYKKLFISKRRIHDGANYWRTHQPMLEKAKATFGVPPALVVAIIGIESDYGRRVPPHRAIDTLTTLAFYGEPRRRHFFQQELAHFFMLCKDMATPPNTVASSYAGAIGFPQFMPSSYRHYAYSANPLKAPDLVHNHDDAIMSVANYFKQAHWQKDQPIAKYAGDFHSTLSPSQHLVVFDAKTHPIQWLVYPNFYAIMAYNHSTHYAMAVTLLAEEIKRTYDQNNRSAGKHQRTAQKRAHPRGQIRL